MRKQVPNKKWVKLSLPISFSNTIFRKQFSKFENKKQKLGDPNKL